MKTVGRVMVGLGLLLGVQGTAQAEPPLLDFGRAYVSLGLGHSWANLDEYESAGLAVDDKDWNYSLGVGYRFNQYIALEAGYLNLGEASAAASGATTGNVGGYPYSATGAVDIKAEVDGWYLGPRVSFNVLDKLDVEGTIGAYFWSADYSASYTGTLTYRGTTQVGGASITDSDSGTDVYAGLGLAYKLNDQFSLRTGYTRYNIDDFDVDTFGVSVSYNFGSIK
ncbi:MAG: porin family protein [Magnetococcales bacterium]|nr:porin family protein [Magnetococcales bacterium]